MPLAMLIPIVAMGRRWNHRAIQDTSENRKEEYLQCSMSDEQFVLQEYVSMAQV